MRKHIIIYTFGALAACSTPSQQSEQETPTEMQQAETTLQEILEQKKATFEEKADSTKKAVYAEGIASVVNAKITETALQVGDLAPDFRLKNAMGEEISLYEQLKSGPVILIWYRGGWCPYCNLTLKAMQDMLPLYRLGGAQLLALTP